MKRFTIKMRLVCMSVIPLLIMSWVLGYIYNQALYMNIRGRMWMGLQSTAHAVSALVPDAESVTRSDLDPLHAGLTYHITIYINDTAVCSTMSSKYEGSRASTDIVQTVIRDGEDYKTEDIYVNKDRYIGCYAPYYDADGNIIGMVLATEPYTVLEDALDYVTSNVTIVTGLAVLVIAVITYMLARSIAIAIKAAHQCVLQLSSGKLNIDNIKVRKRTDEIGDITNSVRDLCNILSSTVQSIKDLSKVVLENGTKLDEDCAQMAETASNVSLAIGEVSNGATSQAEDVENMTMQVDNMGTNVEGIVSSMANLRDSNGTLKDLIMQTRKVMTELQDSVTEVARNVDSVSVNVKNNDDIVSQVLEFVAMINDIAGKTNLLSLNAAIEAARAGESGRGFAVVADSIKQLSDQSKQSAAKIGEIVAHLTDTSQDSIQLTDRMTSALESQTDRMNSTKQYFDQVLDEMEKVTECVHKTDEQVGLIDGCRQKITDSITNLSAVMQENAAACEETTASMQEFAGITQIQKQSAESLADVASELDGKLQFFELD